MTHKQITRPDGATIAYNLTAGTTPGVIFLHGLMSDQGGTKAMVLEAHCRAKGYGYLRFDMYGHGASSGRFEDGGVSRWRDDSLAVLDHLTAGPQVLVGSSMGGWVAIKTIMARPGRIAGFVGIAAAPDFTEDLMWRELTEDQRTAIMRDGVIEVPSEYDNGPYRISRHLIEDGAANLVLGADIPIRCPVRLLHGQRDSSVPWQRSLMLAEKIAGEDVDVLLIKDGDHRLSRPQDLAQLCATVDRVVEQATASQAETQ